MENKEKEVKVPKIPKEKRETREIDAESATYLKMSKYLNQIFRGLYVFRVRRGDVVSASVTFFAMMGFFPILFLLISLYAKIVGDPTIAFNHLVTGIKTAIPELAPWILKSIKTILKGYLSNTTSSNIINIVLLIFVWIEFSKSLIFGINTISKREISVNILEDLKSLFGGVLLSLYMLLILFLISNPNLLFQSLKDSFLKDLINVAIKFSVVQAIVSLVFFSGFYMWITPVKIRFKDAVMGAVCFVALFVIGKTFYWVYLHYTKSEMISNFGNFYTIIVAVVWVYYLVSSFFIGASISHAYVDLRKMEVPPAPPDIKDPDKS